MRHLSSARRRILRGATIGTLDAVTFKRRQPRYSQERISARRQCVFWPTQSNGFRNSGLKDGPVRGLGQMRGVAYST